MHARIYELHTVYICTETLKFVWLFDESEEEENMVPASSAVLILTLINEVL